MSDTLKRAGVAAAAAAAETVNLNRNQVTDIAANLPPPAAMEKLTWQNVRLVATAVGGVLVATGVIASNEDLQQMLHYADVAVAAGTAIVGAAVAAWPIIYRNWSTFRARRKAGI